MSKRPTSDSPSPSALSVVIEPSFFADFVPRTRFPAACTQPIHTSDDGRLSSGPSSPSRLARSCCSVDWKSEGRSPSYRYASVVSPTATSGWAYSEACDGASLPTNGTESSRRERGMSVVPRSAASAAISAAAAGRTRRGSPS